MANTLYDKGRGVASAEKFGQPAISAPVGSKALSLAEGEDELALILLLTA